jgi:hypothetical protein
MNIILSTLVVDVITLIVPIILSLVAAIVSVVKLKFSLKTQGDLQRVLVSTIDKEGRGKEIVEQLHLLLDDQRIDLQTRQALIKSFEEMIIKAANELDENEKAKVTLTLISSTEKGKENYIINNVHKATLPAAS